MKRHKVTIIPLILTQLENDNYHILVETVLTDGLLGKWAIDTGASKTVFDIGLNKHFSSIEPDNTEVKSAGIGEGHIETGMGELHNLSIGDINLQNWPVALIDLQFINSIYSKFTDSKLVGLLGSDFLHRFHAVINFKKLEMKLYY